MSNPRYVRSKYSEQAEKWPVESEGVIHWHCRTDTGESIWLPKSEYIECTSPTRDVTHECEITDAGTKIVHGNYTVAHITWPASPDHGYRFSLNGGVLKMAKG